ncbi:MAG TPA: uracil-DNA glycosylase family protein [Blastocatellia bacterium]|nr:uracil-DNA glycosylase family protein [Blastocatellia bacterium]
MPTDDSEELREIADQVREHLRFYREIGVTSIEGAARPKPAATAGIGGAPAFLAKPVVAESSLLQAPSTDSAPAQEPAVALQANLFGEAPIERPTRAASIPAPVLVPLRRDGSLDEIREDLGDCTRCRLHSHRTRIVFGEGNPKARLMFIGEGPGADEDASGRPFVGRAGQLLDKIIASIGLSRDEVYIANIVKCRPPENRTPERDEVATCEPFLFRQVAVISPIVIVALGAPAFQCILRTREPITRVRGEWRDWNGIKVMPTFHPAYLLRVPDRKRETWEDMKKVRDYLNSLVS